MNNDFLMYSLVLLSHLLSVGLILGIFTSIFVKSRKKGFVFLTIYILLSVYILITGFDFSVVIGSGMLFIYLVMGVLTYFVIKRKRLHETVM
ncbi:hypothetical protein [Bacillus sinesaloumensis]|uniref:hypothetical protein n=1 Tax=Litchfieldia sinesaloumensis TaxID=1926280 RepID=UPI0009885F22|nr:hypothetical protein [Bacillus sinesaloumensis]